MASIVVVDSGILITGVFNEPLTARAKALLGYWQEQNFQLVAPTLFRYEVVAVARKAVFQSRITPEEGIQARDFMLQYPVQTHFDEILLKRAYEMATRYNRPTAYDSQYLALAERLEVEFWTVDERLFNRVNSDLTWVKWLGNFTPAV